MASTLPYAALDALSTQLQTLSGLSGRVRAVHADPEDALTFPSVAMVPRRLEFVRRTEDEVGVNATVFAANSQLVCVGTFEGELELRVYETEAFRREKYQDLITNLFLSQADAPGVLTVSASNLIVGGQTLTPAFAVPAMFELASAEWRDELVFARQRFAFLTLDMSFPALVLRTGVYDITTLVLQLTRDLTGLTPVIDESVQVAADGTFTPYP